MSREAARRARNVKGRRGPPHDALQTARKEAKEANPKPDCVVSELWGSETASLI
jgi:hypothetical protein